MYHLAPPDRYLKRARTIVGVIFGGFVVLDVLLFFSIVPEFRERLALQLGLNTMWNAVFLGAIWQRQNWARYVLSVFLLLSVLFGAVVTIPQLLAANVPVPPFLIALLAFHLVALLVIAFNPTIRKFVYSR
jgi:hypothetical protein